MSKKHKNIAAGSEDFLRYTGDQMSELERNTFEKNLQRDPFENDAADGFSTINTDDLNKDLTYLSSEIAKRSVKRKSANWYRIAASVAIIITVSVVFYTQVRNKIEHGTGTLITSESVSRQEKEKADDQKINGPEESRKPLMIPEKQSNIDAAQSTKVIPAQKIRSKEKEATPLMDITDQKTEIKNETQPSVPEERKRDLMKPVSATISYDSSIEKQVLKQGKTNQDNFIGYKTIPGIIVSDQNDLPLPGVSVFNEVTGYEAVSDIRGEFTIPVPQDSPVFLVASYPDLERKKIQVENNIPLRIQMQHIPASYKSDASTAIESGKRARVSKMQDMELQVQTKYIPPLPMNGYAGFNEYISSNQRYPSDSMIEQAIVVLNVLINENGRPDSMIILKSPGNEFSSEAIRLVNEGPDWIPAIRNGQKVKEGIQLRIIFNSPEK